MTKKWLCFKDMRKEEEMNMNNTWGLNVAIIRLFPCQPPLDETEYHCTQQSSDLTSGNNLEWIFNAYN